MLHCKAMRHRWHAGILVLCHFTVYCALIPAADSPFSFREQNPRSLELLESGRPVYVYNHGGILKPGFPETMRRSTYLHPVYSPGGVLITDDFNADHSYHRGISWMWPVVEVGGKTYDMWAVGEWTAGEMRHKFIRWTKRETAPDIAVLGVENGWYIGDRKVVDEHVEIRATRTSGGQRRLDFRLRFEASGEPVEIAGSPERVKGSPERRKGFGGFCFRFAPRDGGPAATVIRTDRGIEPGDDNMGVHPWAQVEGRFQGRPAGARIEDDPANPGHPNGWLTRHKFALLNPAYPGLKPAALVRGKPLVLKYRVTLWDGEAGPPPTER